MAPKKEFYNLDVIRAIPILDVCDSLGIAVEKRGKNYWCKVRPEHTASVILHPDTNCFYDFGNQAHGNNISFVEYACGVSAGEAIRKLASAFDIAPTESDKDLLIKPLTSWEYMKIGLHGDMASKNIDFPVTTATTDELLDLEYAFRMSMNELRVEDPDAYCEILKAKAVPFVENKRQLYFLSVWNYYDLLHEFGHHTNFFDSERTQEKFEKQTKDLEQSERALYKACYGTKLEVVEPSHYDPLRVWSHLMLGKLQISLGDLSLEDVKSLCTSQNTTVCEQAMSYDEYCCYHFDGHSHAAVFNGKDVTLYYPGTDKDFFNQLYSFPIKRPHIPLDQLILNADRKQTNTDFNLKRENQFEFSR